MKSHSITIENGDTFTLKAVTVPSSATVTWSSGSSAVAAVSNGVVTAAGAGNTVITASVTVSGVTYTDTCTVVVPSTT